MLQLPSDQLVTVPFCGFGIPTTDFVLPPIIGSDSSTIQTQQYGIPPIQQKDPDLGGLPVLRTETNGVLQFYSNVLYFINQGGQFTFDAAQSTALTGYSQGAVLFNFPTNSYVISLIDNNTFDFVTTPSYIDGIHWEQLNKLTYPDITDVAGLVSIIGSAGLFVENHVACNTTLNVGSDADIGGTLTVGGTFLFNSSGQFSDGIEVLGLASTFYIAAARGGLAIFANSSTEAYLGSNNTSTGGYNGLIFDDTLGRPRLSTPSAMVTNTGELACVADIPTPGSNANGYFVQYADGLIEQRGMAIIAAGNGTITATLPRTVTNIPSNTVLATVGELTAGNVLTPIGNAFLSSSSTIQISVTANFTNSQPVFWSVTGY